jgi:hypothetical protein
MRQTVRSRANVHKARRRRMGSRARPSIYDWFTEGFDTADLQEAKALLETLA